MILVLGLLILVVAVVVAVAGVFSNLGSGHAFRGFAVLGHHVTGSTGTLLLFGIVVGAVGVFGLSLLLTAARRTSRRGGAARSDLRQSIRGSTVHLPATAISYLALAAPACSTADLIGSKSSWRPRRVISTGQLALTWLPNR
jgi:hypothetical protein